MIVRNLALLASDTARTKAYIQEMIHNDLIPEICVVYSDDLKKLEDECLNYKKNVEESLYFDIKEPLLWTLNRNKVSYVTVDDKDINSEKMATCIEKLSQQYLVYSGYGGYILPKHLFHMEKNLSMFMREYYLNTEKAQQFIIVIWKESSLVQQQSF